MWSSAACVIGPPPDTEDSTKKDGGITTDVGPRDKDAPDTSTKDDVTSPPDVPNQPDQEKDAGAKEAPIQDKDPQDTNTTPEEIVKDAIIIPKAFAAIKLDSTKWALPAVLKADKQLFVTARAANVYVVAGSTGFYKFNNKKALARVDSKPVFGIAAYKNAQVVVAHANEIMLWDGTDLSPTTLHNNLDGSAVTALQFRSENSFWIGTKNSLWLLDGDQLKQFPGIKGVKSMMRTSSTESLIIIDQLDQQVLLREDTKNKTWLTRSFSNEGVNLQNLTTRKGPELDFWGFGQQNDLYLRKVAGGNAAWWPYRLKPDQDDNDLVKIQMVLFQQSEEETWALSDKEFYRLSEDTVQVLDRPAGLGVLVSASSANDGSLWFSDGTNLVRIGKNSKPVTYVADIKPIIDNNCIKGCHTVGDAKATPPVPAGVASFFPLENYTQVKNKAASKVQGTNRSVLLERVSVKKDMPQKGPLPNNEILLFESWVRGGMIEK